MRAKHIMVPLGAALLVIGLAGYFGAAGPAHWTALIPAGLGAAALLALLMRSARVAMGVGVAVCLLALFGGASALAQIPAVLAGEATAATASRAATAAVALMGLAALGYAAFKQKGA